MAVLDSLRHDAQTYFHDVAKDITTIIEELVDNFLIEPNHLPVWTVLNHPWYFSCRFSKNKEDFYQGFTARNFHTGQEIFRWVDTTCLNLDKMAVTANGNVYYCIYGPGILYQLNIFTGKMVERNVRDHCYRVLAHHQRVILHTQCGIQQIVPMNQLLCEHYDIDSVVLDPRNGRFYYQVGKEIYDDQNQFVVQSRRHTSDSDLYICPQGQIWFKETKLGPFRFIHQLP